MAALGTVGVYGGVHHPLPTLYPITDYDVVRGKFLGAVTVIDVRQPMPELHPVSNYIVRQIRVVYRQIWPDHGQRFPQ